MTFKTIKKKSTLEIVIQQIKMEIKNGNLKTDYFTPYFLKKTSLLLDLKTSDLDGYSTPYFFKHVCLLLILDISDLAGCSTPYFSKDVWVKIHLEHNNLKLFKNILL